MQQIRADAAGGPNFGFIPGKRRPLSFGYIYGNDTFKCVIIILIEITAQYAYGKAADWRWSATCATRDEPNNLDAFHNGVCAASLLLVT